MPDDPTSLTLTELNTAATADAAAMLRPCCASRRWLDQMVGARPYRDRTTLLDHSGAALAGSSWADLREAIDAHPRIGDRAEGAGTEARWSRSEQSAAATEDDRVKDELRQGNKVYEQRFGHVFLICATGLSSAAVLTALRQRLDNTPDTEREVVRTELTRIVALRLDKLVTS